MNKELKKTRFFQPAICAGAQITSLSKGDKAPESRLL